MIKIETVLYKGEDGPKAMKIYNSLVHHLDHRVPIKISDSNKKIYKSNVYLTDVVKTFKNGNHIVAVRYDPNADIKYSTWIEG